MPIYKQTTEITNIDDIWTGVDKDIVEIYFGNKNVFTVWGEYEGTLPATINSNGDDMRQYQIYGAAGGVGDRTVQLFDKTATDTDNGYIVRAYLKSDGTVVSDNGLNVSEYIPVSGNTVYILRYGLESGYYNAPSVCFYDISKDFISGSSYSNSNPKSFTTPAAADYVRISFSRTDANMVVLVKGSTIPEPMPPFGYEVDISTSYGTGRIRTPIYIGDEPLEKNEYIDYQAGKIYRYETEIKNDVSQTGWQWRWVTDNVTHQTAANNRVSVGRFYPEDAKEYIISAVPDTFEVAVISADESDVKTADSGWGASWTLSGASAHSFCVTVRKSDNANITPSEVDGVKFKVTTLTPADPPVTLPALPTCEGETVVDYAGESVAQPEKAILKYRKKNF